ncbi:hypothetical protein OIDMADRAFT_110650 [Oidiodendron maius Zn]|uniref:Xylanolytic transcriptional activator regulatory domain-containing protein n=1 Tax=Oidiodendron maius (strain Zn) TaxID=913774 RepID=A0A0C3D685_OIDMZ|nr:hypothetical protein OIDMADRAFT_110650 [Oidiodendron maius Zn]
MGFPIVSAPQEETAASRTCHQDRRLVPSILGDVTSVTPDFLLRRYNNYLPDYIETLSPRLSQQEVLYLTKSEALRIPSDELRDALLRSYVDFIHPFIPVLNIRQFLTSIDGLDASGGKLSIQLFQAVMFAGTAFVDMQFLHAAGYTTRRAAREIFYKRAELLCEYSCTQDVMSHIQSILLISYWGDLHNGYKDTWYWMGIAISMAKEIKLHKDLYIDIGADQHRLRRRLWWLCIMQDSIIALSMRRSTRLGGDRDVPILTLDDFEIEELPPTAACISSACHYTRNPGVQHEMAIICLEKVKLCQILRQVLLVQYTVDQSDEDMNIAAEPKLGLRPSREATKLSQFRACESRLQIWAEQLPIRAAYQRPIQPSLFEAALLLKLHCATLRMLYLTTMIIFYRPIQITIGPSFNQSADFSNVPLRQFARHTVRLAAEEISEISNDLNGLKMLHFLPVIGVTALVTATVEHMVASCSPDPNVRNLALQQFKTSYQYINLLQSQHPLAVDATNFIHAAVCSFQIRADNAELLTQAIGLSQSDNTYYEKRGEDNCLW